MRCLSYLEAQTALRNSWATIRAGNRVNGFLLNFFRQMVA